MTPTQILQLKSEKLFTKIQSQVGNSTMDLINELVENELQLERECNK